MSYSLLKGKKGIIFGALNELSITCKIAEITHEEGAVFTLTNTPVVIRMGIGCCPVIYSLSAYPGRV